MGFPLHKLPIDTVQHVLRRMEIYDQLTYSLCSKNTKKMVKSLGLRARTIELCVNDYIEIYICFGESIYFWTYFNHGYNFSDEEFSIPWLIEVVAAKNIKEQISWKWFSATIGIREYLHHFIDVLQHPRVDELYFDDEFENADFIVPVQKVLKGLQTFEFSLAELLTNEFSWIALKGFDHYDQLDLKRIPFERHEVVRMNKIFMKNLWRVLIAEADKITIDQVLISNWEEIQLNRTGFNEKDLNLFLKLWIKGSNPRLNYFNAGTFFPLDRNVILKGIKCLQIPMDNEEVYRRNVDNYYQETRLAGGSKIRRFDGTQAVVVIEDHSFKIIIDI